MANIEQALEQIFERAHVSIALLDTGFHFVRVNQTFAHQHDRPIDYFPGKNFLGMCPYSIRKIVENIGDGSKPTYIPAHRLGSLERPESKSDWTLNPVPDEDGKTELYVLTSYEVPKSIYLNQSEQESQDWFRCLSELSDEAMVVHANGKICNFNRAALELFGYSDQDWANQNLQTFIAPESLEEAMRTIRSCTSKSYELTGLTRQGDRIPLEVHARSITYAGQEARCVILRDITERKFAQTTLYTRGTMLRQAAKLAQLGNWVWSADRNRCTHFSREYARIIGVSVEEALDRYATREQENELIHPDDRERYWKVVDQAETDGSSYQVETRIVRPDGQLRYVMIVGEHIFDDEGELSRAVGTLQDVTEFKLSQARLLEAKEEAEFANKAKSEFLSRMSHELRTPLNAILGFSQLLELDNENLTTEQNEGVSLILSAGRHLLRLIDEVLDIARVDSGNMNLTLKPVSLAHALSSSMLLIKPLASKYHVTVEVGPNIDFHVRADQQRLKQVLVNLLSNAVKYNCKDGKVKIEAEPIEGGLVRIAVSDTGPGIRAEDRAALFEPFTRVGGTQHTEDGTGIGLAITKRLVELMGGVIGVDSEYGEGTTFWFALAGGVAEDEIRAEEDLAALPKASNALKRLKILYVEDVPINMELMRQMIRRITGGELLCAEDAVTGIEIARKEQPDLVLMDIGLPGMNGFEALEVLKAGEETSSIPVMAVTAHAMPEQVEQARNSAFRHYLVKPVMMNELIEALNDIVQDV